MVDVVVVATCHSMPLQLFTCNLEAGFSHASSMQSLQRRNAQGVVAANGVRLGKGKGYGEVGRLQLARELRLNGQGDRLVCHQVEWGILTALGAVDPTITPVLSGQN